MNKNVIKYEDLPEHTRRNYDEEMARRRRGEPEHHEPQFTGAWMPEDVYQLVLDRRVSAFEVLVLMFVEAYVASDHGCRRTDKELAKDLHTTESKVRKAVEDLGLRKLLKVKYSPGESGLLERDLETFWSRWGAVRVDTSERGG